MSPVHPFSEDSGATLKATQELGNGIESIWKGSSVLSLFRIWQTHPGDPAQAGVVLGSNSQL